MRPSQGGGCRHPVVSDDPEEAEQEAIQPEIGSPAEETPADAVAEAREEQREEGRWSDAVVGLPALFLLRPCG